MFSITPCAPRYLYTSFRMSLKCLTSKNYSNFIRDRFYLIKQPMHKMIQTSTFQLKDIVNNPGKTDEIDQENLNLILSEHSLLVEEGQHVPQTLTESDIEELLLIKNARGRERFLLFLGHKQYKKQQEKLKKEANRIITDRPMKKNKYFFRFLPQTILNYHRSNEIANFHFNSPLIFDFDYEKCMSPQESRALIKQLILIRHVNKYFVEPFPIYFQNYNKDSFLDKNLRKQLCLDTTPIITSSEDYMNEFPKERLCYLTPHAPNMLNKFEHDTIYIIGGIVDKSGQGPLSFAKARKQGIRMAKLPLDVYMKWKIGSKYLNLVTMVKILHDFKVTGNWEFAFRHIPNRVVAKPNKYPRDPDEALLRTLKLPRNLIVKN